MSRYYFNPWFSDNELWWRHGQGHTSGTWRSQNSKSGGLLKALTAVLNSISLLKKAINVIGLILSFKIE